MTQAYCRGLLAPDYPQGANSVARENMILWALAMENIGKDIESRTNLDVAIYGPHIDIEKSGGYIKGTKRLLRYAAEKKQFSLRTMSEMFVSRAESVQALVDMWNAAQDSGIVEKFRQAVEERLKNNR